MERHYNIALLPSQPQPFIDYARTLDKRCPHDRYLLGEKSLPHVTLCHFSAEETTIPSIWQALQLLPHPPIELIFTTQRNKTYPKHLKWGGVQWLSLIPNQIDKLNQLHRLVANVIKNPTNLSFDDYDPHLTLLNSCDEEKSQQIATLVQLQVPLKDQFKLVLGLSDDVGQLVEILY